MQKELQSVHYVTKGHHVLPYNLKKKILVFDPWAAVWLPLCLTLCKVPARMKLKWKLSATEIMSWSLTLETDSLHSTHFLGSPCTDTLLLGSSSCSHQWPTFWALLVPHSHSTLCAPRLYMRDWSQAFWEGSGDLMIELQTVGRQLSRAEAWPVGNRRRRGR